MSSELILKENFHPALFSSDFNLKNVNPAASYLSTLSASGRESMRSRINQVVRAITGNKMDSDDYQRFDWSSLRRFHYEQIINTMRNLKGESGQPLYSANHLKTTWMALRKIAEQSWSLGILDSEEFLKIKEMSFDFGKGKPPGRAVPPTETRHVIDACLESGRIKGVRDAALIALLAGTGMRRFEVANLSIENYNKTTGELVFLGKRNKVRECFLQPSVKHLVDEWVEEIRGYEPGPLFLGVKSNDSLSGRGLTGNGIYRIVRERIEDAALEHASPHDFRKGLATFLLDGGVDIVEVRDILGHESVATTQVYVRKNKQKLRESANTFSL